MSERQEFLSPEGQAFFNGIENPKPDPRIPIFNNITAQSRRGTASSGLRFRFRFAQTDDFVPGFKLTALLEEFHALKSFQNVALRCDGAEAF